MRRSGRLNDPRLLRHDWTGDAVLTLVAGAILVAGVFLPWVNARTSGQVNFSTTQSREFNGVLATQWGVPALALAILVVLVGLAMLLTRPRRASILLGMLVSALGAGVVGVAQDAAAHIGYDEPGLGMYLTTLVGVLLVPIGVAAALVAWLVVRAERRAPEGPPAVAPGPPTAPPAPESAPPN